MAFEKVERNRVSQANDKPTLRIGKNNGGTYFSTKALELFDMGNNSNVLVEKGTGEDSGKIKLSFLPTGGNYKVSTKKRIISCNAIADVLGKGNVYELTKLEGENACIVDSSKPYGTDSLTTGYSGAAANGSEGSEAPLSEKENAVYQMAVLEDVITKAEDIKIAKRLADRGLLKQSETNPNQWDVVKS